MKNRQSSVLGNLQKCSAKTKKSVKLDEHTHATKRKLTVINILYWLPVMFRVTWRAMKAHSLGFLPHPVDLCCDGEFTVYRHSTDA